MCHATRTRLYSSPKCPIPGRFMRDKSKFVHIRSPSQGSSTLNLMILVWFYWEMIEKTASWSVFLLRKKIEMYFPHMIYCSRIFSCMSIQIAYILPGVIFNTRLKGVTSHRYITPPCHVKLIQYQKVLRMPTIRPPAA